MLTALRIVLETVSSGFRAQPFIRFPLVSKSGPEIREFLRRPENILQIQSYLSDVQAVVAAANADG